MFLIRTASPEVPPTKLKYGLLYYCKWPHAVTVQVRRPSPSPSLRVRVNCYRCRFQKKIKIIKPIAFIKPIRRLEMGGVRHRPVVCNARLPHHT